MYKRKYIKSKLNKIFIWHLDELKTINVFQNWNTFGLCVNNNYSDFFQCDFKKKHTHTYTQKICTINI